MAGKSVTTRYLAPVVTVPAGTTTVTPLVVAVPLGGDLTVWENVQVVIPDGHAGLTGIRFEYDGAPILPWNNAALWIVGNGEQPTFDVNFEAAHPVTVKAYNADIFPHSFYLRFKVSDLLVTPTVTATNIIPISSAARRTS